MLKAAYDLKSRGASRIFGIASFAQFTEGLSGFNAAYSEGVISNIIATNLIYRSDELQQAPWFIEANMARYVSLLIDAVNHDASLSKLISPTTKINKLLEFYKNRPNN